MSCIVYQRCASSNRLRIVFRTQLSCDRRLPDSPPPPPPRLPPPPFQLPLKHKPNDSKHYASVRRWEHMVVAGKQDLMSKCKGRV